jgi:hypothetical protein
MNKDEMEKHMWFLHDYAVKHGILFRVSRQGITIEEWNGLRQCKQPLSKEVK